MRAISPDIARRWTSGLTPEHWRETRESIRRCNEIAGLGDPDVVAFLGWEWSQVGDTPDAHYGHKNVILRDLDDDRVPARPIAAPPRLLAPFTSGGRSLWDRISVPVLDWTNRQRYFDFGRFQRELAGVAPCPDAVDVRELPEDCHEIADDPAELFEKLRSLDKQLAPGQHDPDLQRLIEVYSGHGNSEEYRDWTEFAAGGERTACSEPTAAYVPCCWQAGEIVRSRCKDAASDECERRVADARRNFVEGGHYGHLTVPGTEPADWRLACRPPRAALQGRVLQPVGSPARDHARRSRSYPAAERAGGRRPRVDRGPVAHAAVFRRPRRLRRRVRGSRVAAVGRETLYYVRATQQPTLAVNAGGACCEYDAEGNCVRARPCYGDWRTSADDDCLSPNEERAWSSPIRVMSNR